MELSREELLVFMCGILVHCHQMWTLRIDRAPCSLIFLIAVHMASPFSWPSLFQQHSQGGLSACIHLSEAVCWDSEWVGLVFLRNLHGNIHDSLPCLIVCLPIEARTVVDAEVDLQLKLPDPTQTMQ